MTDNRQLICELDVLTVTAECLLQTFLAIEEGMLNGDCEIQPQAICVPITVLGETVKELKEISNGLSLCGLKGGAK